MAQATAPTHPAQTSPPLWRDVRVLRVVVQVVFGLLVVAVVAYLYGNLRSNLARSGLPTGFGWLDGPARVDIRDSDFRPTQPVRDALLVGFLNTIRVSALGIALATVLGTTIGVLRLSSNWLARKTAALYVETVRNIPVLVWIIFTYVAVVLNFPPITEPVKALGAFVLSNSGAAVPYLDGGTSTGLLLALLGAGLVAALLVAVWRTRRFDATGEPHHRVAIGLAVLLAIGVAGWLLLPDPGSLTLPTLEEGAFRVQGGIVLGPEYAALLAALVIYTASHIAEIVRGSILAVPKGQTEAAEAIALSNGQRLRFVVLPQALRIAIPPLANQYLNLTKNSSLAVAIGYFDLTRITGQTIANSNPAPQAIGVLMLAYLVLSLTISLVANVVNRTLSLERRT